jgi:diketogulonate reductase-like aldo/keto reductase
MDQQRVRSIRAAVELGLTFIDTAELYGGGRSEQIIGKAVAGIRDRVFIATKFRPEHASKRGVRQALEGSLERLRTDYVDLYQMHWPNPSSVSMSETIEALLELRSEGKIRHIGLSNFTTAEFRYAQEIAGSMIVSNQLEYNPVERSPEFDWIPYAQESSMTTIAYSPFNQGRLGLGGARLRALKRIAETHRATVHQLVLQWLIAKPTVIAIPKAGSVEHVKENARAAEFNVSSDELRQIDQLTAREIVYVEPSKICIGDLDGRPGYMRLEDAKENRLDLVPNPVSLAENILKWGMQKPVRLFSLLESGGLYKYQIIGENLRYWAWVLAYGENRPMPAYVIDQTGD